MYLFTRLSLTALLALLPLASQAEMVRCTSPDGKSSTLQRGKCKDAGDIQTSVTAVKPLAPVQPVSNPFDDGLRAYETGDFARAFSIFTPLAEKGHPTAQLLLGDMYHYGKGVEKSDATAFAWTRKAAEQGNAHGEAALGVMYQEGWGTPKNDAEAVVWFRKAADQGYDTAQVTLGFIYANGRGVPKDEAQSLAWFRKAADQGNADAKAILAQQPQ